jgi:hypothetical protein
METEVSHVKAIATEEAWKQLKNFFEKTRQIPEQH